MPVIKKLDKKTFALQKKIYGLSYCIPNLATQLPYELFGIEAFSFKNVYLQCIGQQLQHELNDHGQIGTIYRSLINYILEKHGRALNIPRITFHNCTRSPITRILFIHKMLACIHLKYKLEKFLLLPTPLEKVWMESLNNHPHITPHSSIKFLYKLLLHHITDIYHLTLPMGDCLKDHNDFKYYYTTPT